MNTGTSHNNSISLGAQFFKMRDYTPIPLIFMLFIVSRPSIFSATVGCLLIIAGELLRIYSVSFIGSVSRTRSDSLGQALVTRGPFKYTRNPLYIANFFIAMGFCVFASAFWLTILTVALFAIQYHFIVCYEENNLKKTFGSDYDIYCQTVPAWLPNFWPSLTDLDWPDNFSPALKSEKRTLTAIACVLSLLILFS